MYFFLHAPLCAHLFLYDAQVMKGSWCECDPRSKCFVASQCPVLTLTSLGLFLIAHRLLAPTKSTTQAKRQHVLFASACLLMMHCRRWISTGIEWVSKDTKYGLGLRRFCHSEAKVATLNFLCR